MQDICIVKVGPYKVFILVSPNEKTPKKRVAEEDRTNLDIHQTKQTN